jgi:hypothetical protein
MKTFVFRKKFLELKKKTLNWFTSLKRKYQKCYLQK